MVDQVINLCEVQTNKAITCRSCDKNDERVHATVGYAVAAKNNAPPRQGRALKLVSIVHNSISWISTSGEFIINKIIINRK